MLLGFVLDCIVGDPVSIPHPIRYIGKAISGFEKLYRKVFPKTERGELAGGACMALSVLAAAGLAAGGILYIAYRINKWLYFAAAAIICFQMTAAKCLRDESMKVYKCLRDEGIEAARKQIGMLVGRDTENLTEEQIVKAAVETVAENTSDGVVAPMFWMLLFGPVGGILYKAVNTMDSMVGYKNDEYFYFGRFAAKLDDVCNFVPARLSALFMMIGARLAGFDAANAIRIWKRDRTKHASPNSAQTESVCAGALRIRLAGDAYYFGKLFEKPFIGDPIKDIEAEDISRACTLMYYTSAVSLVFFQLIGWAAVLVK